MAAAKDVEQLCCRHSLFSQAYFAALHCSAVLLTHSSPSPLLHLVQITERYPIDGSEVKNNRRDMRSGVYKSVHVHVVGV